MHLQSMNDRKVFELLVLSQNLVTVLFIYIEFARFANLDNWFGKALNTAFDRFADHREVGGRMMLTHLYLLIGLGIATNLTYILLDGGFPDGEMASFMYSGVAFLGVADVAAAILGFKFASTYWRINAHMKSHDGTTYAILFCSIIYYTFCANLYPAMCSMFLIIFFGIFCTCIVEGWTTQFDNLVCPLVFFIVLHQCYDYFIFSA